MKKNIIKYIITFMLVFTLFTVPVVSDYTNIRLHEKAQAFIIPAGEEMLLNLITFFTISALGISTVATGIQDSVFEDMKAGLDVAYDSFGTLPVISQIALVWLAGRNTITDPDITAEFPNATETEKLSARQLYEEIYADNKVSGREMIEKLDLTSQMQDALATKSELFDGTNPNGLFIYSTSLDRSQFSYNGITYEKYDNAAGNKMYGDINCLLNITNSDFYYDLASCGNVYINSTATKEYSSNYVYTIINYYDTLKNLYEVQMRLYLEDNQLVDKYLGKHYQFDYYYHKYEIRIYVVNPDNTKTFLNPTSYQYDVNSYGVMSIFNLINLMNQYSSVPHMLESSSYNVGSITNIALSLANYHIGMAYNGAIKAGYDYPIDISGDNTSPILEPDYYPTKTTASAWEYSLDYDNTSPTITVATDSAGTIGVPDVIPDNPDVTVDLSILGTILQTLTDIKNALLEFGDTSGISDLIAGMQSNLLENFGVNYILSIFNRLLEIDTAGIMPVITFNMLGLWSAATDSVESTFGIPLYYPFVESEFLLVDFTMLTENEYLGMSVLAWFKILILCMFAIDILLSLKQKISRALGGM